MGKTRNHMALSERYGVEEGRYTRAGQNYMDEEDPRDFEQRLAKAANNDWDTREQQRAFDLALRDEEFRSGLDKETRSFVDNYNKGKDHDKGMSGIRTINDAHTINDFGKLWHKHESSKGGKFTSVTDFGGATQHMDDRMRKFHDRNFALKGENEDAVPEQEDNNGVADPNADLSPEHQQAQDLLSKYTESVGSGQFTKDLYADPVSADKPQHNENVSQQQTAAENNTSMIDVDAFADKQKSMASMYLDRFKENMSKDMNFQRVI